MMKLPSPIRQLQGLPTIIDLPRYQPIIDLPRYQAIIDLLPYQLTIDLPPYPLTIDLPPHQLITDLPPERSKKWRAPGATQILRYRELFILCYDTFKKSMFYSNPVWPQIPRLK